MIPTESILVTSSYVSVPPIDTLPVNVPVAPDTLPLKLAAVAIPVMLMPPAPVMPYPTGTSAP